MPDAWSFPIVLVGEFGKQSREFSICFEGESPLDDLTFLLTTWTQKPNAVCNLTLFCGCGCSN